MRLRLASSLVLAAALALVAGSAGAQSARPPAATATAGAASARSNGVTLRGVQTPLETVAERSVRAATVQPLPQIAPPTPLMSMLPTREAPACRPACSRSYYFCLAAADGTEECGGVFAQCVSRCDRTIG